MAGAEVRLEHLTCGYADAVAVRDVTVTVPPGELLTLLGPSGSGKTTTLMAVAGFVSPMAGDVLIDGRSVARLPPEKRNLGVVFQSYALFPHMNVFDNVAFPLRMRRLDRKSVEDATTEALALTELDGLGERRTRELSGGQQQRVALARALVFRPPVLLMDEPLGALDRKLREQMKLELKRLQRELGVTVLYVTHDQDEALALSDRIAILHGGAIQQVGSPRELYERPASPLVADFFGESNFLHGEVEFANDDETRIRLEGGHSVGAAASGLAIGRDVTILVRPETVRIARTSGDGEPDALDAVVTDVEYLGAVTRYQVRLGPHQLTVREHAGPGAQAVAPGARIRVTWDRSHATVFPR